MIGTKMGTKLQSYDRMGAAVLAPVSLSRLYLLRLGYLVMAIGLAASKWPLIINHDGPWPLI